MYLMYVDESGDVGLNNSPTRYFVLSGLVVHELRWRSCLDQLISIRRTLKNRFGLRLREEFHASAFISDPGALIRISRDNRLAMLREFADGLSTIPDIAAINVIVDKQGKPSTVDIFERAWTVLIQRFENTITSRNFPGPANADERGMLFCDNTDDKKLMSLLRRSRHFNPIPNQSGFGFGYRNLPLSHIIEDPSFRDSAESYFIQAVDLVAYLVYQNHAPNKFMHRKSGRNYFYRLRPILCRAASPRDPDGIVRI